MKRDFNNTTYIFNCQAVVNGSTTSFKNLNVRKATDNIHIGI